MLDLSPLYRSTVGFERLAQLFEQVADFETSSYPPYNIVRLSENDYVIAVALAGFAPEDIVIEVKDHTLAVWSKDFDEIEGGDLLHQGLEARSFKRRFEIADDVQVTGAEMDNGMLRIMLKREVPAAMKPWVVPIRKGPVTKPAEAKKAA
jgi:molecular chaperone IbpA